MKARLSIQIIVVLLVSINVVRSQEDTVKFPHVEISGSFLYSMSSIPNYYSYKGVDWESRTYTWAIQSGVGVFIVGYLEVGIDVRYQRTRSEYDYPPFPYDLSGSRYSSTSDLIVSVGPGYNLPLGSRVWTFLHIKAGLYWSANSSGSGTDESPKWSTNQTVFPIIQGGFKLFLSTRTALIAQLQYDRLTDANRRTTTFGMGLAIYY